VASGLAAWRTGGLEAGIAMHAVNNVLTFFVVVLFGGWSQAFVGAQTTGTPMMLVLALAVNGLALGLILWQAKRVRLQAYSQPGVRPVNPSGYQSTPAHPVSPYPAP
jgi:hypothetical protein